MRKYFEIFKYSLKTKINFIFDYIVLLVSFAIHVFVFNELWDYILQGKENIAGYTKPQLIWYIILGEFIMYSCNKKYDYIADQVKSGQIANMLVRPVDFIKYTVAEDLSVLVRFTINVIFAIVLGIVFAGPIDLTATGIIVTMVSVAISVMMGIYIQLIIGLLAFYTEENDSFWLVTQKMMLLLVFTPLEFYPSVVKNIFSVLPTTYITYAPARIFAKFEMNESIETLACQTVAFIVLVVFARILYRRGVEKINVNGG